MQSITRFLTTVYSPKRIALAATVAVVSLFVLSFAWLALTKMARRKVNEQLTRTAARIGMPIEVGDWNLTWGGATFEDIVVGTDAAVVISRVTATVELNPFADDFGQLASIVIHRVRAKQSLGAWRGRVDALRATAKTTSGEQALEAKGAAVQKALEKIFASLPSNKIFLRSAAITVTDDQGDETVSVRGLKVMVDKKASKALFQVASVRTVAGLAEKNLEGRFELMPQDNAYRFYLRRRAQRAKVKTLPSGWSVNGRLSKDLTGVDASFDAASVPSILEGATAAIFGPNPRLSLKGSLKASRTPEGAYQFDAALASRGTRIFVPLISTQVLGPVLFDAKASGLVALDDRQLTLTEGSIDFPAANTRTPARFNVTGQGRLPGTQWREATFAITATLPTTACQTLLDAAPPGLLPTLKDFKLSGEAQAGLTVRFDGRNPEGLFYDLHDARYGCKVTSMPQAYSPEYLAGPFTIQRQISKDDEPLEVSVSPMRHGFTPLAQISKTVPAAFTTSEDAAFYSHKGIDTFAIDSALRRNLTEKRVAVGGSTITMQTAKNLFLNQERTISRKLQELFLAWHLEKVLDKDRILEIYVNIVELGPGIYGVTQAAEHFFGKEPYDLTLLEAAYLAALLPNPKARYQYFCDGKMTPAFQEMVYGILKRMVTLNRISYDRYFMALSAGLHFSKESRASAHECTQRSWVKPAATAALVPPAIEATGRRPQAEE